MADPRTGPWWLDEMCQQVARCKAAEARAEVAETELSSLKESGVRIRQHLLDAKAEIERVRDVASAEIVRCDKAEKRAVAAERKLAALVGILGHMVDVCKHHPHLLPEYQGPHLRAEAERAFAAAEEAQ